MNQLNFKSRHGLTRILWLVNLLFALVLGLGLWLSYQQHLRHAQEQVDNTTLTLERSLSGMFDQIDLVLTSVTDELENSLSQGPLNPADITRLIRRRAPHIPGLNVLLYSDATGQVAANTGYPASSAAFSVQDRDYFQYLQQHAMSGMANSKPVLGRVSNKWVIVFARAYYAPGQHFAGVALTSVDLDRFSQLFAELKLSRHSLITLLDRNATHMARHPDAAGVRTWPAAHEAIKEAVNSGTNYRIMNVTSAEEGVERIQALRKLASRPYWVSVGVSLNEEMAPWRQQALLALLVMGLFAAFTGTAGRQLQHSWRRQEEAHAVLKSTLEASDNGILVAHQQGQAAHSNRRFAQMWHIPQALIDSGNEQAMLDIAMNQLVNPQSFMDRVNNLHADSEAETLDTLELKDGRVFERSSHPMRLNEKAAGRVWSFHDITERQRIDTLLNFIAQRSWIESKQEFLPALADCLGRLLKVEYALIDKLGDEPGTAETAGLYAHGSILPNLNYALAGTPCENVIGKEICVYRQSVQQLFPEDGLLVDMKVEGYLGVPLWDSAGQPIGLIALLDSKPLEHADQAIALIKLVAAAAGAELERLREEKRLRLARDRAQGYLDTVEAMIIVLDRTGGIIQINRKGCQLLGWQESELLGQCWFDKCLPPEEGPARVYPLFQQLMAGEVEATKYFENEIVTQSGQRLHMAWHNAVLRDEQGNITGTLSAGEDITERKLRDSELEGYRHHLEELVNIRTHELAVAKERAESSNRAKSVFLANMSHELRTPLNAILGFAQLLQHDPGLQAESHKRLATINRSGQHLLALINDVLEISRIEAGRTETRASAFHLPDLLNGLTEMIQLRAELKGLSFEMTQSADLPLDVMGDAHHLKQVLINLLGNAVKYTDQGLVSLRVSVVNGEIQFEVRDTGQGIDLPDQENIFQAFFQTEAGIAKGEGTGLGLAISREYAHLMGGELAVRSQLGQGSVFTLRVPLPATHATAPSHTLNQGRIIGLANESTPPRILVVDDKADNRDLVCQILALAGFQAETAENGQQAVDCFVRWQPQLIWMDMRMPVMDGYEATRQIRSLPGGMAVKIVALTASAFEEDRAEIMSAGCDDMVRKPVEEARLFQLMGELLGLRYRYQEEATTQASPAPARLDLLLLPETLRMELKAAAEKLDQETMRLLVDQIRQDGHVTLAQGLAELVAQYRFDRIADLCA